MDALIERLVKTKKNTRLEKLTEVRAELFVEFKKNNEEQLSNVINQDFLDGVNDIKQFNQEMAA